METSIIVADPASNSNPILQLEYFLEMKKTFLWKVRREIEGSLLGPTETIPEKENRHKVSGYAAGKGNTL